MEIPTQFEVGTPSIAQSIGRGIDIKYLTNIGMIRIEEFEREIRGYFLQRMMDVSGLTVLGPQSLEDWGITIVAFISDSVDPSDLPIFLDMERIAVLAGHYCCQPLHSAVRVCHSARVSLYFYNTKEFFPYILHI